MAHKGKGAMDGKTPWAKKTKRMGIPDLKPGAEPGAEPQQKRMKTDPESSTCVDLGMAHLLSVYSAHELPPEDTGAFVEDIQKGIDAITWTPQRLLQALSLLTSHSDPKPLAKLLKTIEDSPAWVLKFCLDYAVAFRNPPVMEVLLEKKIALNLVAPFLLAVQMGYQTGVRILLYAIKARGIEFPDLLRHATETALPLVADPEEHGAMHALLADLASSGY